MEWSTSDFLSSLLSKLRFVRSFSIVVDPFEVVTTSFSVYPKCLLNLLEDLRKVENGILLISERGHGQDKNKAFPVKGSSDTP